MRPVTLVLVEVETAHFTFRGVGATEREARKALAQVWTNHVNATGADPEYINVLEDGNVFKLQSGQGWRDDQVVTRLGRR
jgi:hypothetical protein